MKISCLIFIMLGNYLPDCFALSTISESNNALDLQLYEEVTKGNDHNVVYSPYTLQTILAQLVIGAGGETASQIKKAMKLNVENQVIKDEFRNLTNTLSDINFLTVNSASRSYLAKNVKIKLNYIKTLEEDFGSSIENINFGNGKEAAAKINSWIEKETHGKITEIMREEDLDQLTRFVLVNTLYLRGQWIHTFKDNETKKADFHKSNTEKIQVDMMKTKGYFRMTKIPELEVTLLQLHFANTDYRFVIALPDKIDGLAEVEKNSEQIWAHYNYTRTYVEVHLPKFRFESNINMIPLLRNMGITKLFGSADLSGITEEPVHVSFLRQKTFIAVNEKGVESASALPAIGRGRMAVFEKPKLEIFKVDHPFMFSIFYKHIRLITGRITHL